MRLGFLIAITFLWMLSTARVSAQWVTFVNETATRISAAPEVSTSDPAEKDYAWGDLDRDGDIDLVCVRKWPITCPGGKRNVLFMNENGVLVDRTIQFASAADVHGSQGFMDETNERDVVMVDVDGDGWLDLVTATTYSDGLPKYVGHPRVYRNLGEISGIWQGLRFEDFRMPQLLSKTGVPANPRFNAVAAGDVTGDGYVDLYFADSDTGEVGPLEAAANDMDNKLLINVGAANPGVFVDESTLRMGSTFSYPGEGMHNYLWSHFGGSCAIADMNGDGYNDVVKLSTLSAPGDHTAIIRNNPLNVGFFDSYTIVEQVTSLYCSVGDLNNDGKKDLVITEDNTDRYLLNTGIPGSWPPTFNMLLFAGQVSLGTEGGFGGQSVIADLDNDGWSDVLIGDVDVLTDGCNRRARIYHNQGDAPNVTLLEEAPSVIPTNMLNGVYDFAVFDINGDGWNDIVIGRCSSSGNNCSGTPQGSTQVWMNVPQIRIDFALQGSVPQSISPLSQHEILVDVHPVGGALEAGSVLLHTRINSGAWTQAAMTSVGGETFRGLLPAAGCHDKIQFYFSANLEGGGIFYHPPLGAPYATTAASSISNNLESFEQAPTPGWTVLNDPTLTGGAWEQVDPIGTISGGQSAAPEDDAEPGSHLICWITGQGVVGGSTSAADVDGGATMLISPAIDLSGGDAIISYARWFFGGAGDTYQVHVSNDGGSNWALVETAPVSTSVWQSESFLVSDYFPGQPLSNNVRVRFTVADTGSATTCEGGLDAFRVSRFVCVCDCSADMNADQFRDGADIQELVDCFLIPGQSHCLCADSNGDGVLDETDVAGVVNQIIAAGPCSK